MTNAHEETVQRLSRIDTSTLPPDGGPRFNRLIFEKSPYLLQHAENPVDWRPWNEEAFEQARSLDKPVFLSIGYSTCHWCHVMEEESFEDAEVARVVNRHFIPIKVDREERPDIDTTFMNVCQMMTGSGGWPLNLVLAPDGRPFFAATYIPKTPRGGMVGLIQLLEKITELWESDREKLEQSGRQVFQALQSLDQEGEKGGEIDEIPLKKAFQGFLELFDRRYGGFGNTLKFPTPHNLSLLLRLEQRLGDERAGAMALQTLRAMRMGGIFDQIGFGIHRYSVDARWLVPHFEKMLYDQALVALACIDALQASGDPFHGRTASEILDYVLRDLAHPEGGFYCGEDADSEGAEGTFYLWTPAQVKEVLGDDLAAIFCRSYDITEGGNFEGKSIPHLEEDIASLAARAKVDQQELASLLEQARNRLFEARQKRIRPHRDDKILTGWNGLAIAALARSGTVLGVERFLCAARASADFILSRLRTPEGRLLRRWREGEAAIPAFLEDYAFFTWGLIELYEGGFESRYLKEALELNRQMEDLFGDGEGGYFDSGSDVPAVLVRSRSLHDGAVPSGNSVAALNLLRLGRLSGNHSLEERGERLLATRFDRLSSHPLAYSQALMALDFALEPGTDVVLAAGTDGRPPGDLLEVLRRRFLPHLTMLMTRPEESDLADLTSLAEGKVPLDGKPAAYLCRKGACREPVTTPGELEKLLE